MSCLCTLGNATFPRIQLAACGKHQQQQVLSESSRQRSTTLTHRPPSPSVPLSRPLFHPLSFIHDNFFYSSDEGQEDVLLQQEATDKYPRTLSIRSGHCFPVPKPGPRSNQRCRRKAGTGPGSATSATAGSAAGAASSTATAASEGTRAELIIVSEKTVAHQAKLQLLMVSPLPSRQPSRDLREMNGQVAPSNSSSPASSSAASSKQPAYPWSTRRLQLPPPAILPKPGSVPPSSPSPSPFPRYGHSLPAVATQGGELLLFGGLVKDSVRNDLYSFNTKELSATLLQTAGEVPSPRVGHASALVSSVLIVWGGDTKSDGRSVASDTQDDGLYLLNLGTSFQTTDETHAAHDELKYIYSHPRVDTCCYFRSFASWSVWACCRDGRDTVLRIWRAGRRRVPQ